MKQNVFKGKNRIEIENLIDLWVVGINHAERNRQIMKRRYIDGITFEKLGEEFELTDWQVKNICYECLKLIKV